MELPRFLRGIEVDEPNEIDISVINERLGQSISSDSIFVVSSGSRRYHVVAAALKILRMNWISLTVPSLKTQTGTQTIIPSSPLML